ncbi:DUF6228 family protein [Streptomyces natalensis]|uniref:DUF6228 family protein n=1 Tax=Streptomyces natalensis TaxID=68242 RepID=UPI000ADB360B|nr:DUF6228 family protein [Streptomyces natalensis]
MALTCSWPSWRKNSGGGTVTRTWCSLERDLTVSAKHVGSHVQLTWGLHGQLPERDWLLLARYLQSVRIATQVATR